MKQITESLLEVFQPFRMQPTPLDEYEQKGKAILADKLETFVQRNAPIEFAMLGFPFKSINKRDKVLGSLPDLGEELTMKNFARFNSVIKSVYTPGVKVTIISDGYVFNDLMGITDNEVQAYKEVSVDMAKETPVQLLDLNDFFPAGSLSEKREKVMAQFGITAERLEADILTNPDVNFLYRGMIRFMSEELAIKNYPSGNQLHKAAKQLARNMMFRNEAYSNLVKEEFASAVRLSMHPSVNNGAKYSFKLIPGERATHSAWHCVIVEDGSEHVTMHRKDAEAAGYGVVSNNGRPYFYSAY